MTIESFPQARLVIEKAVGIQGLVAKEIISAAAVVLASTFRDDRDQGAAVVAIFGRIVISQHFHFRDGVLIDRHADFVAATGFTGVEPVDRSHRATAALP